MGKRKLQAKGIASVGARVINLRERFPSLDHGAVCDSLAAEFRDVHSASGVPIEELSAESELANEPAMKGFRDELGSSDFRLGRTPDFSHQLDTRIDGIAVFDVHMQVVGGKIEAATIFSDALFPGVIDLAMQALTGIDYGRTSIRIALEGLRPKFEDEGPRAALDALIEWLPANIDD